MSVADTFTRNVHPSSAAVPPTAIEAGIAATKSMITPARILSEDLAPICSRFPACAPPDAPRGLAEVPVGAVWRRSGQPPVGAHRVTSTPRADDDADGVGGEGAYLRAGRTGQAIFNIPEIIWELALGLFATFWGFRASSPILSREAGDAT